MSYKIKIFLSSRFEFVELRKLIMKNKFEEEHIEIIALDEEKRQTHGDIRSAIEASLMDARHSDIYLLILGESYGNKLSEYQNKSYTHLEYEEAKKHNMYMRIFPIGDIYLDPKNIKYSDDKNFKDWQLSIFQKDRSKEKHGILAKSMPSNTSPEKAYQVIKDSVKNMIGTLLQKGIEINKIQTKNKVSSNEFFPANTKLIRDRLYDKVQHLIAMHGINDQLWSKAISSQYFMTGISRLLNLTKQTEYKDLLNKFLQSFHHQIDETLILEKDHILVTPEELKKIIECMKQEDTKDGYFSRSDKTKGENIDAWKLHYNYLYGLAVEISSDKEYKILNDIHNLSLSELIYDGKQTELDAHGGWYPYRIPWITARVLIALKNSNIEDREDYPYIKEIILKGLQSLVQRIYDEKYWKSGVGEWVSNWESTALCLEALSAWSYDMDKENKITKVIKYVIKEEEKWLITPPNLSSESDSNLTLASVLMVCTLLQISSNHSFYHNEEIDISRYLKYLENVLSLLDSKKEINSRQFSTIPQIAYYIIKTIK